MVQMEEKMYYEKLLTIVREANQFQSYIVFETNDVVINGKSLISVSTFLKQNNQMTVRAVGNDAKDAVEAIKKLI